MLGRFAALALQVGAVVYPRKRKPAKTDCKQGQHLAAVSGGPGHLRL